MKLSISNIGWESSYNDLILKKMQEDGFDGLEIAPTMLIKENPYDNIPLAVQLVKEIKNKYGLCISSMQSIWFGKKGNIFDDADAIELIEYTKKAIDFASAINCKNLVFGCPKNRNIPEGKTSDDAINFFRIIGNYAKAKNTILSIEPNPSIYGTNFINYTKDAFDFVRKINCEGIKVNVDLGTIIENDESLDILVDNFDLINHIHISEPNLTKIQNRKVHILLLDILKKYKYDKFISLEMKKTDNINDMIESEKYVATIFR